HRAKVGGAGPLARGASRALSGTPAGEDSVRADSPGRQLQTDGKVVSPLTAAAACLTGKLPPTGPEMSGAQGRVLALRAVALSLAGQNASGDSLHHDSAEQPGDFLSDLPRSAARRVPVCRWSA